MSVILCQWVWLVVNKLPGRYIDVGNSVEVLQQVVSLYISSSQCWTEEAQSKVGEREEVSEAFHGLHSGVQSIHVNELWTSKHSEPSAHLKHHVLLLLMQFQ